MPKLRFLVKPPGCDRRHHIDQRDVEVVLSRLPAQLYERLRAVHFTDGARGRRTLGYVQRARREISICALPPRVSLTSSISRKKQRVTPRRFGALRGAQWTGLAVRRFLLYDVFLHELGHMQVIDPQAKSTRRRFADETKAQAFADEWRERLWATPSGLADPAHDPPGEAELHLVERVLRAPLPRADRLELRNLLEFHLYRLGQGIDSSFREILAELGHRAGVDPSLLD